MSDCMSLYAIELVEGDVEKGKDKGRKGRRERSVMSLIS